MSKSQVGNKSQTSKFDDGAKNFDSSKGNGQQNRNKSMAASSKRGHVQLSEIGSDMDSDSEQKKSKHRDTRKHGKMASVALNDVQDQDKPDGEQDLALPKKASQGYYLSRTKKTYDDSNSTDSEVADDGELDLKSNELSSLKSAQMNQMKKIEEIKEAIEQSQKKALLGKNQDIQLTHNKRFKNFADLFSNLVKPTQVLTEFPMVSACITYNSKFTVTVTKKDDSLFYVKLFSLSTYECAFQEKIGGREDQYIKLRDVYQDDDGRQFAVVYFDDGKFRLRTFSDDVILEGNQNKDAINEFNKNEVAQIAERSPKTIEQNEVDLNKAFGINDNTMVIDTFNHPFIACCWLNKELVFVNLFHVPSLTHWHCVYNQRTKEILQKESIPLGYDRGSNKQNFPYNSYYNRQFNEVYCFYRQGQAIRIPITAISHPENAGKAPYNLQQIITNRCLAQMYMVDETALIARSSDKILFFKLKYDEVTKSDQWTNYAQLNIPGELFFIKGNKRIQITTTNEIYFYLIDFDTFEPTLENVMQNFMQCNQMMYGSKVRYCVTYKNNQKSFDVYTRKYEHNFKSTAVDEDLSKSRGLRVPSMNAFLVSTGATIKFYDIDAFNEFKECQIKIPLLQAQAGQRQPNQVINMQISGNEEYLAVISGTNVIMNQQQPNQLFIFKRERTFKENEMDKFILKKQIRIRESFKELKASLSFYFKLPLKGGTKTDILIFADCDRIFELNFETNEIYDTCTFVYPLTTQPTIFTQNSDQMASIVSGPTDCIYFNHEKNEMVDLDQLFGVQAIKEIEYDAEDRVFYLLSNKYKDKLGVFLLRFDEDNPLNMKFILRIKNRLEIDDADVVVIRDEVNKYKELLISYKTIYMNTYNMQVIDLISDEQWTIYKHDSFQLWESKIFGFYMHKTYDYVTINTDGISLVNFGQGGGKREISKKGTGKLIHSLESMNYLKIDSKNFIHFDFAGAKKVISIVQQYTKYNPKSGSETAYETIQNIQIEDLTLREILLLYSIFVSKTQSDILAMVKFQPKPAIFFKSLLEFDAANLVSMLSFDSKSIKELLDDKNEDYFQSEFPIFYKNQIQKTNNKKKKFYRSAISNALRSNQIRAVEYMIKYIQKYQNSYESFYLFRKLFSTLLEKDIEMSELLSSNIFMHQLDFDEWPSTHTNPETQFKAYNGSYFDLRGKYKEIFPFEGKDSKEGDIKDEKVYKISYQINMLTALGEHVLMSPDGKKSFKNEEVSVLGMCLEADQLSIFEVECIKQLITYRWDMFALNFHAIGAFATLFYIMVLLVYVQNIYIDDDNTNQGTLNGLVIAGACAPTFYEFRQISIQGWSYFKNVGNILKMLYVIGSVMNIIFQMTRDPHEFWTKFCLILVQILQIHKAFYFLRLFTKLSAIVTMLGDVFSDLKVFLFFYYVLILLFSMTFAILGIGNEEQGGAFKQLWEAAEAVKGDGIADYPGSEYYHVGKFLGYFITTLRISMGDFDFAACQYLEVEENIMFWILWYLVVYVALLIFLNFIIAETSKSYTNIDENLEATISEQKAVLCAEAEVMKFNFEKNDEWFPKYILIRTVEN